MAKAEKNQRKDPIAVTGASGNVGGELAARLLSAGEGVRAVARGAEKLKRLGERGAEVRPGSLEDRAFLTGAFRGASAVFAMVPPNYGAPDFRAYQRAIAESLAAAIRDAGVKRAVTLSSFGAELPEGTGPIAGLHLLEELLNRIPGLNVVHLRAAYFMENHLASIGLIKSAGVNGSPIKSDVAIPMVATRDIAAKAAEALTGPGFEGRAVRYVLGPREYTLAEATRILGAAVGRPDLKYVELPEADARKGMLGAGLSPSLADLYLEMQRAISAGRIKPEPRSPANTTPTTLEEFARSVFAPAFGG